MFPSEVKNLTYREAVYYDLTNLLDLERKCFDECWSLEEWKIRLKDCFVMVADATQPVGFVASRHLPNDMGEIMKLCVLPSYRRNGIGSRLLKESLSNFGSHKIEEVMLIVPEHDIDVHGPWLAKRGFKAETPLLKDCFTYMGELEPGIKFTVGKKCLNTSQAPAR